MTVQLIPTGHVTLSRPAFFFFTVGSLLKEMGRKCFPNTIVFLLIHFFIHFAVISHQFSKRQGNAHEELRSYRLKVTGDIFILSMHSSIFPQLNSPESLARDWTIKTCVYWKYKNMNLDTLLKYLFFNLFCIKLQDRPSQPHFLLVVKSHQGSPQLVKWLLRFDNLLDLRKCTAHFTTKQVFFFVNFLSL